MPSATATRLPPDRAVIGVVLALSAVGVVAVYSAVAFLAAKTGGSAESLLFKHLFHVGLGLAAVAAFSRVDYRWLARYSRLGMVLSLVPLVLVQAIGAVTNGAQRWLDLGVVNYQPSDVAKVALILHVAVLLTKKQEYIGDFARGFVPLLVWIVPTLLLIGLEDLSTAVVMAMTMGAMLFVGRVPMKTLILTALVALIPVVGMLATSPQRLARVEAFIGVDLSESNNDQAALTSGDENYQADQARIAFAMGGLTGQGPGKSVQRDFLPAPYNDFIFAIISEEYGLVGACVVLLFFVLLLARGFLRIARGAPDPLGLFLATGLTTAVVLYGFVNAAVATGLLPVTGLAMPFISYGGTSLLVSGAMIGLLLNVSRHVRDADL